MRSDRATGIAAATYRHAVARAGLALLCSCLAGGAIRAEETPEPRWIPSLDLGFSTFDYIADASVQNNINPPWLEDTQENPNRQFEWQIGGELMGPAFENLPGRPRPFIQGRVQITPFAAERIFKTGEIRGETELQVEAFDRSRFFAETERNCVALNNCPIMATTDFVGQGAEIDVDFQNPSWFAALGMAFQIPVNEAWLLQVKPSASYFYERIDMSGQFRTVTEIDVDNPDTLFFQIDASTADAKVSNHNLGVGLEIAASLFRQDLPIRTLIYMDAQFMFLLGDPTTEFVDASGIAMYTVDRERFGIRGGAGLRFSWMGFGER